MNKYKLEISSPTSISLGNITWFALDTKLVGSVGYVLKENEILKHRLNDMVFGDDYELGARYLRKIGYIDFDEKRKVYINKHNNEPFYHHDEKEKDYYIKEDELNEYTESLEYKLKKIEEYVDSRNDIPIEVVVNIKNIINGGRNE